MSFYETNVVITVPLYSYDVVMLDIEAQRFGKTRDQLLIELIQNYVAEIYKQTAREEEESERMGDEG